MINVRELCERINNELFHGNIGYQRLRFNEPMSQHTSYKTGGPADIFFEATSAEEIIQLKTFADQNGYPVFILGGGANLLVADKGIRGIVIYTGRLSEISIQGTLIHAGCGASISDISKKALEYGLRGLEFIYAMPGSLGGALFMNARCYNGEISQIARKVTVINNSNKLFEITLDSSMFDYKKSPFQNSGEICVTATLELIPGDKKTIKSRMDEIEKDRQDKGHFQFPCAGSVFKNNRKFGQPSGVIIDKCALKGLTLGGAQVAPFHGNIIINTGNAVSRDIKSLILNVQEEVEKKTGFLLEPEVQFVGEW